MSDYMGPVGAQQQGAQPVYVVQQQGPATAVTKSRKKTSHGLHLVLTVCTFGMWGLFVWLPLTVWHKMGPKAKSTTYYR